jgi:hypothetical protein
MTDQACHVSASPDIQPIPWSEERGSRVSGANPKDAECALDDRDGDQTIDLGWGRDPNH